MRRMAFCAGMSLMGVAVTIRDGNYFAASILALATFVCTYLSIAIRALDPTTFTGGPNNEAR